AGQDCYILKVAAPDLERLQDLLRDLRGPSPTVEMSTRTTIVLGTVFEQPGFVPTELDGWPACAARRWSPISSSACSGDRPISRSASASGSCPRSCSPVCGSSSPACCCSP